jgi:hypothetical protein
MLLFGLQGDASSGCTVVPDRGGWALAVEPGFAKTGRAKTVKAEIACIVFSVRLTLESNRDESSQAANSRMLAKAGTRARSRMWTARRFQPPDWIG